MIVCKRVICQENSVSENVVKMNKNEQWLKGYNFFFQQHNFRVCAVMNLISDVPLSEQIVYHNKDLQHPMAGLPTWLNGYMQFDKCID